MNLGLLTLDFETYWDREYSLSRLTTEAYVRDRRFKAHMVGLKWNVEPAAVWPAVLTPPRTWEEQRFHLIDWSKTAALAHHAHFEGLILSDHYLAKPAFWFDTLSMARIVFPGEKHGLHALAQRLGLPVVEKRGLASSLGKEDLDPETWEALAADCCRDVELTHACAMKLLPFIPRDELRAIDLTIRLFTEPVLRLDRPRMQAFYERVVAEKAAVLQELGVTKADLQSSERFASLLRALGVEPPTKPSPTGNGEIYAFAKTDEEMRALEGHNDGRVQALAAARLGAKSTLNESRADRLLGMARRGPLPVYIKPSGAHTGRGSGGDQLNWQNLERGGEIRRCITAPHGQKLVIGDLSQIECRMVNWLGGQHDVLNAFRTGADIYSSLASRFYGRPIDRAQPTERQLGKTIELGCGFGMGRDRFRDTCRRGPFGAPPILLSGAEAQAAVDLYRSTHPAVVALWRAADTVLWALAQNHSTIWGPCEVHDRAIWLPGGYPLWYRQLEQEGRDWRLWNGKAWVKIYGAKLVENVVQALAAVVLKEAMLRIAGRYRIALTVHDEVVCIADEGDTDALPFVLAELKRVPTWAEGLPLDAEGVEGVRYEK